MSERLMKNFPIQFEGNTYWRSRSVAVVGFIFCQDKEGRIYVLAEKRGPGTPNYQGYWCVVCGFLDFNEDGQHAVARETFEETGVKIAPEDFHFSGVNFSERDEQNVNLQYWTELPGTIEDYKLSNEANEEGETSDIQWIRTTEVDKYEWAFGHEVAIPEMFDKHISLKNKCAYNVVLEIIEQGTGETMMTETLCICETSEACKEYTAQHIADMIATNEKDEITHEPYNITNSDAVIKWKNKEGKEWYYWYYFCPRIKYPMV